MDAIHQVGEASVNEVLDRLPDPPSYSAVRALLRLLEQKGHLVHQQDGARYIFKPTVSRERARQSALSQVVKTFFDGSTAKAVAALIDISRSKLSEDELDRLADMIDEARKEGR